MINPCSKVAPVLVSIPLVVPALAWAEEGAEEIPAWFPILELGGIVVVAVAVLLLLLAMKGIGGKIGVTFRILVAGLVIIVAGLFWRAYCEAGEITSWKSEFVFETFLYLGLLVVTAGCYRFARLAK